MAIPLTVPIAIDVATKLGLGAFQLAKAGKIKTERPYKEIPIEIYDYLNKAKEMAGKTRLPAQDLMQQDLRQTTMDALSKAQEIGGGSGNVLGALSGLYGNETRGINQLNIAAAQQNRQSQQDLYRAMQTMAGYKDKQWQINELDPYMRDMATKSALLGSGVQNIAGGVSGGMNNLLAMKQLKIMEEYFNKSGQGTGGQGMGNVMGQTNKTKLFDDDIINFFNQYPNLIPNTLQSIIK